MSRKRYISTDISTDAKLVDLSEHGFLPLVLYTWSIPHMDDWGRITGDAKQFKLIVCPGIVISVDEVDKVIELIVAAGLWIRYEVDGKKCISIAKSDKWFKHQSYINKSKRTDDTGSDFPSPDEYRKTPQNAEEHQETPEITEKQQISPRNAVSFSLSVSSSVSSSPSKEISISSIKGENPFGLFETHKFGKLDDLSRDFIGNAIDDYTEDWVIKAIKEAVKHNKISWSYVEGILKRWKATNHPEPWTLEKEIPPPQQTNARSYQKDYRNKKTPLTVVPDQGVGSTLTAEEREAIRRRAMQLDSNKAIP